MSNNYPRLYRMVIDLLLDNGIAIEYPRWRWPRGCDELEAIASKMTEEEQLEFATGEETETQHLRDKYDPEGKLSEFLEDVFQGKYVRNFQPPFEKTSIQVNPDNEMYGTPEELEELVGKFEGPGLYLRDDSFDIVVASDRLLKDTWIKAYQAEEKFWVYRYNVPVGETVFGQLVVVRRDDRL